MEFVDGGILVLVNQAHLMTDDNHKNKKGFSGLSNLASEFKDIEEPKVLETNKSIDLTNSKNPNQVKQQAVQGQKTASSTQPKNPIESGKSASGSSGKWIIGIIGAIIAIQLISLIYSKQQSLSSTSPAPTPSSPISSKPSRTDYQSTSAGSLQSKPTPQFSLPAVSPPKNGELVVKANYTLVAPFEIRSNVGDNYLVKLTDVATGEDALTVFVKGGQTVTTRAPLGRFMVKYASGSTWYGYQHLFGPNTIYSKAEQIFEFKKTISSSAQSRLLDLRRKLSNADDNFRSFLISRGITSKQASYIFNGTDSQTGESGVGRLPKTYWEQFLSKISNPSLYNEIVNKLNARNQISNQIVRLRNQEESIEGFTITLYKVQDGNLQTSQIGAGEF